MLYYRKPAKKQNKLENKYKIIDVHRYPINSGKIFLINDNKYYIMGIKIFQKRQFYIDLKVNLQLDIDRRYRQGSLQLAICLIIDNNYDSPFLIRNIEIPNLYIAYIFGVFRAHHRSVLLLLWIHVPTLSYDRHLALQS